MKLNELMHNDLFVYGGNLCRFVIRPMDAVVERISDKTTYLPCAVREAEPIPLTKEILKVNGFNIGAEDQILKGWYDNELKGQDFYCNARGELGYSIATTMIESADGGMYPCEFADVKYVHELQHALRLCDLNELADNFKVVEE